MVAKVVASRTRVGTRRRRRVRRREHEREERPTSGAAQPARAYNAPRRATGGGSAQCTFVRDRTAAASSLRHVCARTAERT